MPLTVRVLFFVVFFIPIFVSGQSSIAFDGIDDHVSVADDPLFTLDTNNFTIECWVKFSSDPVNGVLIGQDEGSGEQNKWLFGFLGGDLYFHVNGPSTGIVNPLVYAWDPVIGTYYHLALTRSGSRFTLFINGTETASNLHGVTIPDVNAELMIGNGESFFFHGILDDVRFWRSARTLTEIRSSMYRTVDWNESGLTANWRFNENSGLTAYNSIGSLQGTLMNEPQWSTSVPPTGIMTTIRNIPSAGEYQFTGVSFFSVHQSQSAIDTVIVSKFGTPPTGTPPSGATVLHNGYWAVQSTEHGTFSADITFGLGAKSLTLADQEDPGNIKLFRRAVGSTGAWTLAASASSASFGSVTFTGITEYGEFTIGSTTSSHLSGTGGVFQSAASGTWSDGASWFLIGGTDDDGIPDGDDDVTIRAGDEIQLTSSSYVNNLLLLGASTGTRLTVSDNIGLYLYGTLNSDGTVLSPVLIKTGANASVNYHGSGRQIVGNHWSGDVAGWTVNISMSDTARIMTHFKAGALGVNSPTRIGTLDSPKDLFIDGGTENSGTLSVNGSDLFVSGNITRNGTYTSKFASFTASWSTIEIGGTYLSADQIKIGWPDYWYAITNTLRIRSVSGLLINATTYGHMGTLEYVGTGAQTSGNELIGISNIRIKNPFGVQFLSSITVTNLYLDSAGISL